MGGHDTIEPGVGRGAGPAVPASLGFAQKDPGARGGQLIALRSQARRDKVATWELVAALVGLRAVMQGTESLEAGCALRGLRSGGPPLRVRAQVICFIDSNVALGTLLRGSSRLGVNRASQEG